MPSQVPCCVWHPGWFCSAQWSPHCVSALSLPDLSCLPCSGNGKTVEVGSGLCPLFPHFCWYCASLFLKPCSVFDAHWHSSIWFNSTEILSNIMILFLMKIIDASNGTSIKWHNRVHTNTFTSSLNWKPHVCCSKERIWLLMIWLL